MDLKKLKPKQALNKAFLKRKPNRTDIERFKTNLTHLLDKINDIESEEFHKNLVSDFLKKTYYDPNHFINTKGRNDLVVHNGQGAQTTVGIIIETKKPTNKSEMVTTEKLNVKAFQELMLYYLRERITHKNVELKHVVATNINEWFIFDATMFDRLFAQNKNLVNQFKDFESGRLVETKTEFFYKHIAEPFIDNLSETIEFTYFNIQDYHKPLRNANKTDDHTLIALFKLLSPEHLLKLPFTNDSNNLDKGFYNELLHMIGLTEIKEGGKKLIARNKSEDRHAGTFLEAAIVQLDSLDKISQIVKPDQFGNTQEERLFNVALELSITWINRILFLKLLEAQLMAYHKGDISYSFLNLDNIKNYDDLNSLFFQVLARRHEERSEDVKKIFEKVPYLNSSLYEPTALEQTMLFISNLKDDKTIPIASSTVLKDLQGKKKVGHLRTLEYLFEFLNAYDFSSEGSEVVQEDNKTLINASVLGLIFEKINGYKEGSFFTPGFVTMYMCRETIRKAVVQKFNETKNWQCHSFDDLYDKIENRSEANQIVNSLKICDPAVGSGHFLVSALNEMIAIKNDLRILQDPNGRRLKEYQVEVVNDELIVTDEEGELFEYNPKNKESERIQKTLFHEKQTIIENCLFGVDINTNSVKICCLRLWIELLKNAYYKNDSEIETLPNIDINIKCGNSLVSRYPLDADLKQVLKKSKWSIEIYQMAVDTYRKAVNKTQKREMEALIISIKQSFTTEIRMSDPLRTRLDKLANELYRKFTGTFLFEPEPEYDINNKATEKKRQNEQEKLESEIKQLNAKIDDLKSNTLYENAFEWRFEFPEVLNDDGDFVGFDVVIGNPPYISNKEIDQKYKTAYKKFITAKEQFDLYILFIELAFSISNKNSVHSLIVPDSLLSRSSFKEVRKFLKENANLYKILHIDNVFQEAFVSSCIYFLSKIRCSEKALIHFVKCKNIHNFVAGNYEEKKVDFLTDELINSYRLLFIDKDDLTILRKYFANKPLNEIIEIWRGEELGKNSEYINENISTQSTAIITGENIGRYIFKNNVVYISNKNIKKDLYKYKKEKIVIRQLGTHICAALDTEQRISIQSVYNIYSKDKQYDNTFLLALLNSKLFNFVYTSIYADKQQFPRVLIENIKMMCVPKFSKHIFDKIILLVNKILATPKNETTFLQSQIDELVYQLYDLTEAEIKIVESKG